MGGVSNREWQQMSASSPEWLFVDTDCGRVVASVVRDDRSLLFTARAGLNIGEYISLKDAQRAVEARVIVNERQREREMNRKWWQIL